MSATPPPSLPLSPTELDAIVERECWAHRQPSLALCDDGQLEWLRRFRDSDGHWVWMVSRQRGKSHAALCLAVETCLTTSGAVVRYAAKTAKSARAIVEPILSRLLLHAPEDMRPRIDAQAGHVEWTLDGTVRRLVWAGTDSEQFERLRGPYAHLLLFDEAAFYPDLPSVESALLPQLTTTGGKALYLSTPPETPAHPFAERWRAALGHGRYVHDTIHGNPRLGEAGVGRIIRQEAERLGMTPEELVASTYWRREYLAEIVTEESRAAVPAWTLERAKRLVREVPRPEHFDGYSALDWGYLDGFGLVLAWWWYEQQALVVEDAVRLRGRNSAECAEEVRKREAALWGVDRFEGTTRGRPRLEMVPEYLRGAVLESAPRQPLMRVGDNQPQTLADMRQLYGLAVWPTRKDNKHAAVDELNVMVQREKLYIHPRATQLIEELYGVLWNRQRTEWERTEKGHGELIDCLVYLLRNVLRDRDPRPPQRAWHAPKEAPQDWLGDSPLARRLRK